METSYQWLEVFSFCDRKTFKLNLALVMFLELFVFFSSLTSFINCFYDHYLQNPFKTSTAERKYSSILQFFK